MQNSSSDWRELYRTDDRQTAIDVATTIASMEFDVRWFGKPMVDGDPENPFEHYPPYFIHVRPEHWTALHDVLDELLDEQAEFDHEYERQSSARRVLSVIVLVLLSIVPVLLGLLAAISEFGAAVEPRDERPEPVPGVATG